MPKTASDRHKPQFAKSSPPIMTPYINRRSREYLTSDEVHALQNAACCMGRYGHRDATIILMMYRHALRVSEAMTLRWEQVSFNEAILHVARLKGGVASTHPLTAPQLAALKKLKTENAKICVSPYVFLSSRRARLSASAVRKMVRKAGEAAQLPLPIHPHMLRHSCGYYLASKGIDTRAIQQYMGHANIHNTTIYTALSPDRFKGFWLD